MATGLYADHGSSDRAARPAAVFFPSSRCRPSGQTLLVIPSSPEVINMPASAKAKEAPIKALPLEERIRRRAYELYVERGNQSGSELDDWLQAEDEVCRAQEELSAGSREH
jgi:hypothetical protein